jgi:orotate phosphoribosyltransferase
LPNRGPASYTPEEDGACKIFVTKSNESEADKLTNDPHEKESSPVASFLKLVRGRRGHFRLESGHHGTLWLELDALFAATEQVKPFVETLVELIRPYRVAAVCGPMLGGAFLAQLVAHALGVEFWFTVRVAPATHEGMYQIIYRLPVTFTTRVAGKPVAIIDDVMSAGSALRGTYAELRLHGAVPLVAGALLVLGSTGAQFFAQQGVAVEAVIREPYTMWLPADCPLCAEGQPLEDAAELPAESG